MTRTSTRRSCCPRATGSRSTRRSTRTTAGPWPFGASSRADADVAPAELSEALDTGYEEQAAEHLFLVAAGLDSMVVGEPQILGQVRAAHRRARGGGRGRPGDVGAVPRGRPDRPSGTVRGRLGGAPRGVHRGGPRRGRGSAGWAAHGDARRRRRSRTDGHPGGRGPAGARRRPVHVVNRTLAHARAVAARAGGVASGLEALPDVLRRVRLAILCARTPVPLVSRGSVPSAPGSGRTLFLLDLAMPRNADPGVREVGGVELADIDDLRGRLGAGPPALPSPTSSARARSSPRRPRGSRSAGPWPGWRR